MQDLIKDALHQQREFTDSVSNLIITVNTFGQKAAEMSDNYVNLVNAQRQQWISNPTTDDQKRMDQLQESDVEHLSSTTIDNYINLLYHDAMSTLSTKMLDFIDSSVTKREVVEECGDESEDSCVSPKPNCQVLTPRRSKRIAKVQTLNQQPADLKKRQTSDSNVAVIKKQLKKMVDKPNESTGEGITIQKKMSRFIRGKIFKNTEIESNQLEAKTTTNGSHKLTSATEESTKDNKTAIIQEMHQCKPRNRNNTLSVVTNTNRSTKPIRNTSDKNKTTENTAKEDKEKNKENVNKVAMRKIKNKDFLTATHVELNEEHSNSFINRRNMWERRSLGPGFKYKGSLNINK